MSEPPKVIKPGFWPDPDRIRFPELYKYVGRDQIKIGYSIRNYKSSIFYIGGILFGFLVLKSQVDAAVQLHIFGENNNGGDFLELKTDNNDYDISYNREFQRMRYLTEEPAGNDPHTHTRDEQLIDLGWTFVPKGLDPFAQKRSPHFKYF